MKAPDKSPSPRDAWQRLARLARGHAAALDAGADDGAPLGFATRLASLGMEGRRRSLAFLRWEHWSLRTAAATSLAALVLAFSMASRQATPPPAASILLPIPDLELPSP